MLSTYLKTLFRNLSKNKTYSFLNLFGLATGIACAALIFLWVESEVSFDQFHAKKDRLYAVRVNHLYDTYTATFSSTPGVLGPAMKAEIPGIANTCRVSENEITPLFTVGERAVYAKGSYAEPSLFKMFTLPFVEGNAGSAFNQLHSLVITEKTAKKFFGTTRNVVGRSVRMDRKQDFVVTGVLRDLPEYSTLNFEWLAPFQIYYQQYEWTHSWGNFCLTTYVELKPGVSAGRVNRALYNYIPRKQGASEMTSHAFLFGVNDWHLYDQFDNGRQTGGGQIDNVRLFSLIAWIILFIACINFMNLATARSEKRAREVGVRKVLGAAHRNLILQFLGEALFMSFLASAIAMLIIILVLPAFNLLVQKNLEINLASPTHLGAFLLIALTCGLAAGSYPALYLSSFKPVTVLKGVKFRTPGAGFIRKGLVITQFTVSITLIISTIVIYQQIQHVKNRKLGFNKDNLIEMKLQGDMIKNFEYIKQDLLNTGVVDNAALADHETIYSGNNTGGIQWQGKDPNRNILISQRLVSPEFLSVSRMRLIEGEDFNSGDVANVSDDFRRLKDSAKSINVIITASLAKLLGKGSPLGKTLKLPAGEEDHYFNLQVKGVVADYVYGDMYGKPDPVIFYCLPKFTSLMYIRIKDQTRPEQALKQIAQVMNKDNPGYPFDYKFVDDQFNQMFRSEMLISKLSRVFSVLAIIISCLGLFGLAAYTAERRTKEIGIRKVLGATVGSLAGLLSRDFLQLVLISCILAFPIGWWLMNNWLQSYAYRIGISWVIFLLAGVAAIAIALGTVIGQAVKAALANPVKSLRTE